MTATTPTQTLESFPHRSGAPTKSKKLLWTGRTLSGILSLLLFLDGGMKLVQPLPVVQAMIRLGYPESTIAAVGVILIVCTILYLIPRTAFFGAILLSAYLGGAVTTNLRASQGWFPIFFPVLFGCLVWCGLTLRDARLRSFLANDAIR